MREIIVFIAIFLLAQTGLAKELKRPVKDQTMEALSLNVGAITLTEKEVLYLPIDERFFYSSPYGVQQESQKLAFESLIKSKRFELPKKKFKSSEWAGIIKADSDTILIDGFELIVYQLDTEYKFYRKNDIVWDMILPPRDRIGEATKGEINRVRKKFNLEMRVAPDKRIRGIAFKSESKKTREYFASTSAKSFPIVILSCSKEDVSNCRVTRECRIDSFKNIKANDRGGVAFDKDKNRLFLLDKSRNVIRVASYSDCISSRAIDTLTFDKKMKRIESIAYSNGKLWLGLQQRDDYYNSTIFTFDL